MAKPAKKKRINQEMLQNALDSGEFVQIRRMLNSLSAADVAHLLESTPARERDALWQLVDLENEGDILQYLSDDIQADFLRDMDTDEVVAITEGMDADDVADILQQLPDRVILEVLDSMDEQDRHRVEQVLSYPEDTAGGLMDTDTITVRPNITIDVALRYLRRHEDLPTMTDKLIVVNRNDEVIGQLLLRKLLVANTNLTVREVMDTEVQSIPASMPDGDVAKLFERHDLISTPVVDDFGRLLGRITIDDVVDVIRENADHQVMSRAGLDEDEDTFAPVMRTTPRRAIWLGINLLTAFLASAVIGLFDATIEKVVALAVLMPIVASMGGVAGTQTLTVVIRGMAMGHVNKQNLMWLLNKETVVGALNGVIWGVIVAVATGILFQDATLGFVIGAAIIINIITAAAVGTLLPMALKAVNIDPALAGGVALTTVTDVVGFFAFLGLATAFYA